MKKLFSLEKLTQGIRLSASKYPISILMAALAALVLIHITRTEVQNSEELLSYVFGFCNGISIFFAIHTALNQKSLSGAIKGSLLLLGLVLVWLIVRDIKYHVIDQPEQLLVMRIFGYGLLSHLAVAFLPFTGNFKINAFWQYNKSLFIRAFTTVLYTGVLYAGLSGAILAISELFDVDFGAKIYAYLFFVMALPVTVMIFCAGVPDHIEELESSTDLPNGLRIFVQFILIPLVVLYLLILYAYMAKILFQWSLPQGWVTILIMVFSVLGMLAMLLVYPYQHQKENAWVRWYTKGYYVALIPLLILQYVAIFTRIGDYGFTAPRWAVVAITVWLTWISIYNVFFKGRNIVLIPMTLFAVTVLFLFGPLSYKSISTRSQTAKIQRLLVTLNLVKNGKLQVYKDNPKTDSLMGELYSATNYLNRNCEITGLEPYLHYPTESEIKKNVDSAFVAYTNRTKELEYNRTKRSAIRDILNDQLSKYNIHDYDNSVSSTYGGWIEIEPIQKQETIPPGPWKHYYRFESIYLNSSYDNRIGSSSDNIRLNLPPQESSKANPNYDLHFQLIVNGVEIPMELPPSVITKIERKLKANEYPNIEAENGELTFAFNKNNQQGVLVLDNCVVEAQDANAKLHKINRLSGCIFMK